MTNHIEEMMKTAGVEARCQTEYGACGCKYCQKDYSCKLHRNRADCSYILDGWNFNYYPSFTAEKQLELIKLICETEGFCGFTNFQDENEWSISCGFNFPIGPNPKRGINFNPTFRNCETFEQALAQLTTELMKAGELDKSKVKEILSV